MTFHVPHQRHDRAEGIALHPDGGWIFTNVVQGIGATVSWTRCMVLDDATVRADIILILTSLGGAPYMVDG